MHHRLLKILNKLFSDDELSYLYAPTMPIADYAKASPSKRSIEDTEDTNILFGKIVKIFPSYKKRPRRILGSRNLIIGANSKEVLIAPWLQAKVNQDHLAPAKVHGYGMIAPRLRFRTENRRILGTVAARSRADYMIDHGIDMNSCYLEPECWNQIY